MFNFVFNFIEEIQVQMLKKMNQVQRKYFDW